MAAFFYKNMMNEKLGAIDNSDAVNGQEQELGKKRLQNFEIAMSKRGEAERLTIDETIEELVADLPIKLQKEMIGAFDRFKRKGLKGDDLKEEVIEIGRILKSAYGDVRFGVENKHYAKLQVVKMIVELFEKEDTDMESLKKIARVSFDLNGLKAVNDLTGSHEDGDKYLALMIATLKSEKATAWLTQRKMDFIITADGGDEFGVILRSAEEIDVEEVSEEFVSGIIKSELWESEEAKKILDFDNEEVVLAYAGINKNDWVSKDESERKIILAEIRKDIPDGYFFRAAVSGGVVTLYESIVYAKIKTNDSYEKVLGKVMGSLFDLSDKEMQADKVNFKANLAKSQDPYENFLLKVYSRTDSEKELRNIVEAHELFLRNIEEAMGDDVMSVLPRVIDDLKKQIREIKQRAQKAKI